MIKPLQIHILDIESAINYWRQQPDAINGACLSKPLRVLAQLYGLMAYEKQQWIRVDCLPEDAIQAWLTWYETTSDTPCIAVCSTSQGDNVCKGCGRTFEEIQQWSTMGPVEKRMAWQRITQEGQALRFTRYKERAFTPQ